MGMCFEPTYEELKQHLFTARQNTPFRFEPTYEELKHTIVTKLS